MEPCSTDGGSDVIPGLCGDDTLTGGEGGDQFQFDSGFGHEIITDFAPNSDAVLFTGIADLDTLAEVNL